MGFGKSVHQEKTNDVLEKIQSNLAPQDGGVHAMVFNLFGKYISSLTMCLDEKVTLELEQVLWVLQSNGRRIIDVKMNTLTGGITGNGIAYHIVVLYA